MRSEKLTSTNDEMSNFESSVLNFRWDGECFLFMTTQETNEAPIFLDHFLPINEEALIFCFKQKTAYEIST